jgi:hypothetical protein
MHYFGELGAPKMRLKLFVAHDGSLYLDLFNDASLILWKFFLWHDCCLIIHYQ